MAKPASDTARLVLDRSTPNSTAIVLVRCRQPGEKEDHVA